MDFQRYLLIAAIAVLSFMLMTNWVHFREQQAATTVVQAPHQQDAAAENNSADLPAAPTATPATGSALPQSPAVGGELPSAPGAQAAAPATGQPANQIVHVHTDVLDVSIDLRGGDIVYDALPKFSADLKTPDVPFVLLEQDAQRTYIAQSGLIGLDNDPGRPLFQSKAAQYRLGDADQLVVELTYESPNHLAVIKRFTFHRGNYLIDVNYTVTNNGTQAWHGNLFGQLKRDDSADPSVSAGGLGIHSYLGAATLQQESYHKLPFKDFTKTPFKHQQQGGWIAVVQHYFLSAWVPDAQEQNEFKANTSNGLHLVSFVGPGKTVAPGANAQFQAQLYTGPKDQYRLAAISPMLDRTVDYGILWFIAQPLFWALTKIHGVLGNWGWSIMVLTLGVKLLFFWLNAKAYISMANMRRVQPKLVEIRERYADDRQKQSQEMMKLYKTEKINPLGGCLPVVVQMPVFLALYWVLLESVELRHAPWILWIKDLSAMDPYLILPLLMGVSMFFQQRLNPPPPDPMQAKVMQFMPVIFTFFFLWFPAGLVLYYVVNNLLSIAQQYIITRRIVNKTS